MSAVLSLPAGAGVDAAMVRADRPAAEPALTAVDRLALSRERMRRALRPPADPGAHAASSRAGGSRSGLLDRLKALPIASVLFDAIAGWWSQHPLRIAATVVGAAAKAVAQPMAQRNPLGLAVSTLVVGGLVVWVRPWRWISKPALFAGLLPQLLSKGLAQVPMQSWMDALTALTPGRDEPRPAQPGPPTPAAASPRTPTRQP